MSQFQSTQSVHTYFVPCSPLIFLGLCFQCHIFNLGYSFWAMLFAFCSLSSCVLHSSPPFISNHKRGNPSKEMFAVVTSICYHFIVLNCMLTEISNPTIRWQALKRRRCLSVPLPLSMNLFILHVVLVLLLHLCLVSPPCEHMIVIQYWRSNLSWIFSKLGSITSSCPVWSSHQH